MSFQLCAFVFSITLYSFYVLVEQCRSLQRPNYCANSPKGVNAVEQSGSG